MTTTILAPRASDVIERGLLVSERDTRGKPAWKKMLYMGAYYELERSINGWTIVKTTPIAGVVQSETVVGSRKKTYGCPHCYKKTYTTYELGEKCDVCDEVIGTTYYYQSKARFDNGEGIWIRCKEKECMQMASKDYKVKKVVLED